MKYIYILIFLSSFFGLSQGSWDNLSGEEKAFLYHSARRTEILKTGVFSLFEFTDSIPYIRDTLPDYSYIEREVVKAPAKLIFHSENIDRKSNGLLSDLAVRLVLRELDMVLHYRNSTDDADKHLKEKLRTFERYVLEEVPQKVVRTLNNGDYVLVESVQGYYSPSLSISDKMAAIINAGYSELDQMLILNSIMRAQEKYVNNRLLEVLDLLGVESENSETILSAVGDGSNWSDLKGGIRTPYDKGLPDEKGLFRFVIDQGVNEDTELSYLKIKDIGQFQRKASLSDETVVHIDVFGYHEERQTTVAIQSGGNSYVLYGNNDNRLVSPDSTYGVGTTYWRLMYSLEHVHIAQIKEDLFGKRGYEYQIDSFEKKIENTLMNIKKTEYRLDVIRHTPEGKPKIKKKKIKKKNMGVSDQAGTGHPTSALSKLDKKRNIEQNRLIQLNGQLDEQKRILAKLKEDMEKAYINLVKYETKLDLMKKTMGYNIMSSEEINGVYYFTDGARFNTRTQDFIFPASTETSVYQIYHISFGEKVFSERIEENFIHFDISRSGAEEKYVLSREIRAVEMHRLSKVDSLEMLDLFNFLAEDKTEMECTVVAGGIRGDSKWELFRDSTAVPTEYSEEEKRLPGSIKLNAVFDAKLKVTVTGFEDKMLPKDFSAYKAFYNKLSKKYGAINEIDFYSGIVAKKQAERFIHLLKTKAEKWIKDSGKRSTVLKKLSKVKLKKVYFEASKGNHKVPNYIER